MKMTKPRPNDDLGGGPDTVQAELVPDDADDDADDEQIEALFVSQAAGVKAARAAVRAGERGSRLERRA